MLSSNLLHWLSECIVSAYLADCQNRELRPKTVNWYGYHLRRARDWLHRQPQYHALHFLDPLGLEAYYRSTQGELSRNSRRHLVNALRAFGSWLGRYGLDCPARNLQRPRKKKKLPKTLSPTEVQRLVAALEDEPLRERAVVYLILDAGLRAGEVAHLMRADLDLAYGQLTVVGGKGDKDRVCYYSPLTARALDEYLATHDQPHVFTAEKRPYAPLSPDAIGALIRRLGRRHGFQQLGPHLLRRTSGTEYRRWGVGADVIGDQLGHETTETTIRHYARLGDEDRRAVIRRSSVVEHALADLGIPCPDWPRRH